VASREATSLLLEKTMTRQQPPKIYNIVGGLEAWHDEVDPNFPKY